MSFRVWFGKHECYFDDDDDDDPPSSFESLLTSFSSSSIFFSFESYKVFISSSVSFHLFRFFLHCSMLRIRRTSFFWASVRSIHRRGDDCFFGAMKREWSGWDYSTYPSIGRMAKDEIMIMNFGMTSVVRWFFREAVL